MIAAVRSATLATLLVAVALSGAACTPTAGPLGTPASPVATASTSEPSPTDAAPETASPSAAPSASAATSPSAEPSGSTAPGSVAPATAGPTAKPTATAPAGTTIVRAYFMLGSFTDNPGLAPVLRTVPETKAVAKAAMTALLAGPKGAELEASPAMYTAIPDGTRLLGLSIEGKTATVRLSKEWGLARTTFNVTQPTAQIVYTLTQFSTITKVRIETEAEPASTAIGRSDLQFLGIIPAIFVDRPAWGAAAGNPARISGIANVFEATFRVQVLDAKGGILADEQVMASCGTGCWGTFKKDIAYTVSKGQYGTLRVFEPSAKDGQPTNVTEYRVWLTP